MNVIVTGGAGFIGAHLCERLSVLGYDVTSIDNLISGNPANYVTGVNYIVGNSQNIQDFAKNTVDVVFHLGEYSRVEQSVNEPLFALKNIYSPLPYVIDFCLQNNAKLIYAGSSTKFGDSDSPYSIAKSCNTELVKRMFDVYAGKYAITYFYNVYGDKEVAQGNFATVVAKFIKAKKRGLRVKITGDGKQKRNFTHVEDIVDGLIRVMLSGQGDGYGIGAEQSYTIIELANMIGVEYDFIKSPTGNRTTAELKTNKIKSLGWKQNRRLKDYIAEKVNF